MQVKELELYIHIPFCVQKCLYCDFLSFPADDAAKRNYIDVLLKEIQGYSSGMPVCSVFFGGGTPSILPASWIGEIMDAIRKTFVLRADAEVTLEANPGTLTKEKLDAYLSAGINRLSMGLQSGCNGELKRLGRIHTFENFLEGYRMAREAGFANINVDLMGALPGQTIESYKESLKKVVQLHPKPEHVSVYSLIVEEGTPFWNMDEQGLLDLPDEETERDMYHLAAEFLGSYGYHRYEISNFSLEGKECEHNKGYWTGREYLGLGLGASSYIDGVRFKNPSDMEIYLEKREAFHENILQLSIGQDDEFVNLLKKNGFEEVNSLSLEDKIEEFMFLGLRLTKGVSEEEFSRRFGRSITEVYGPILERNIEEKLLEKQGTVSAFYHLTEKGLDLANFVFQQYLF